MATKLILPENLVEVSNFVLYVRYFEMMSKTFLWMTEDEFIQILVLRREKKWAPSPFTPHSFPRVLHWLEVLLAHTIFNTYHDDQSSGFSSMT